MQLVYNLPVQELLTVPWYENLIDNFHVQRDGEMHHYRHHGLVQVATAMANETNGIALGMIKPRKLVPAIEAVAR